MNNDNEPKKINLYWCPFCHSLNLEFISRSVCIDGPLAGTHTIVQCRSCGASGPHGKNCEEAADKWNKSYKEIKDE